VTVVPVAHTRPLVILGCTASGKSAVAMELASRCGLGIAALDAFTVYRDMDIGTAKPSLDDQRRVPHFLLDMVDPAQTVTLVDVQRAAAQIDRGSVMWVGGTGLYVRAIVDNLQPPPSFDALRQQLEADPDTGQLFARLAQLDPAAAAKCDPLNRRRIIRALEVCLGTGGLFSDAGPGLDQHPPTDFVQVGLRWDRSHIAERIVARIDAQLADGWLDEAERLHQRELSPTARVAIGYAELFAHLEGALSLAQARERIIVRTRQFAVRQERWFRRDPRIMWIEGDTNAVRVADSVLEAWEGHANRQVPRPR
jgi:tRNA dimethylallyltransferase